MSQVDWLSRLLQIITVTGRLEVCCSYGAPWRLVKTQSAAHEIPYHIVLNGRTVIEFLETETEMPRELRGGDVVLLPHGSAYVLHDGSGVAAGPTYARQGFGGWTFKKNDGSGERLEMLCGRFFIEPPHDRLIRSCLPANLVVLPIEKHAANGPGPASSHLDSFVELMRIEATSDKPGGSAILRGLSSALFTQVLRAVIESEQASGGMLAMMGHPRLAPAISAMFAEPTRRWNLADLAHLCGMSRATVVRHFQDKLGCSAADLLTDIRMSLAANELKKLTMSTAAVAESVGYQSAAAFRRVFIDRTGTTPGQWRRLARDGK